MKTNEIALRHFDGGMILHVGVRVTREFRFRVWLALALVKIAGWILRAETRVNKEE